MYEKIIITLSNCTTYGANSTRYLTSIELVLNLEIFMVYQLKLS